MRRMWKSQTNECGQPLSDLERQVLKERHCELFGAWPHERHTLSSNFRLANRQFVVEGHYLKSRILQDFNIPTVVAGHG